MTNVAGPTSQPSRRSFLIGSLLTGVALVACDRPRPVPPEDLADAIQRAEAARPHSGRTVRATLTAGRSVVDLGGPTVETFAYNESVPGPLLRADVGDTLDITVDNGLDRATSVHWHGIALRNDMDGASPATPDIAGGHTWAYRFSAPHAGTYWAHPHTGLDTDYGLYLPVVIDDPREHGDYDAEWIVVLDDWTDGVGPGPQDVFDNLRRGRMGHMSMMGGSGHDGGDVSYPLHVANGRIAAAPTVFAAKPGQRIRIRLINAGADTAYRVCLAGHTMRVTHTDGFPVLPVDVDALLIGMGERYDVEVTARDGAFSLVAAATGSGDLARAILRTAGGDAPAEDYRPAQLYGRLATVETLTAAPSVDLGIGDADTELTAELAGGMMSYDWTINRRRYGHGQPFTVQEGRRVGLTFVNRSMMWHPMHLHGHTFQVAGRGGRPGPRKDTVMVMPGRALRTTLTADNPGTWMLHCHNAYHQAAGMMTSVDYVRS